MRSTTIAVPVGLWKYTVSRVVLPAHVKGNPTCSGNLQLQVNLSKEGSFQQNSFQEEDKKEVENKDMKKQQKMKEKRKKEKEKKEKKKKEREMKMKKNERRRRCSRRRESACGKRSGMFSIEFL